MSSAETYDIAVIGSGYAGSVMAMVAARLGRSVVMLERGSHPRFSIGESSTPLANLLLEEIATQYDLPALKPLAKWGTWQQQYPEIACGLKRGFSFFHHDLDQQGPRLRCDVDRLLVAASPHDEIADTHWFRADFDELLVTQAQQAGVVYQDRVELLSFRELDESVQLCGTQRGANVTFHARYILDATGPRGCLHRLLKLSEAEPSGYPETQALYSHFSGVCKLANEGWVDAGRDAGFPVDAAAVHHVFDGGWIWVLQFNNGITSAGVAMNDASARRFALADGEAAWPRLLHRIPAIRDQFASAAPVQPFTHLPRISFRSAQIVGDHWALLPSAAGFVDPLLSTGFPLALLGVKRIAELLEHDWGTERFAAGMHAYAAATDAELLQTSRLIAALYANMKNFAAFRALTLLYFAAASFSEAARRLGRPHLATSFLLQNDARFGSASLALLTEARAEITSGQTEAFTRKVVDAIRPFDVAGLTDSAGKYSFPVDASDLLASAWKVGASRDEVANMLEQCGFYAATQA